MNVFKLMNVLHDAYTKNPKVEVLLDVGKSKAVDITIEHVFDADGLTGLVIVEDKQLKLPFDKEPDANNE